jgi:hypothetical protein
MTRYVPSLIYVFGNKNGNGFYGVDQYVAAIMQQRLQDNGHAAGLKEFCPCICQIDI